MARSPRPPVPRIDGQRRPDPGARRGAGSEFVLACDLRFASRENALLGQFEVGTGVVPGGGPMARLPRLVGRGRALEILLVADDLDGPRAAHYGYVNREIADDRLDEEIEAIAARLARFDHDAIARTKSYVDRVTLPDDTELPPALADFFEMLGRPAQQAQVRPPAGARAQPRQRPRAVSRPTGGRGASRRLTPHPVRSPPARSKHGQVQLPPDHHRDAPAVLAGLTDFGPGRSDIFPNSSDDDLEVHDQGPDQADVTEGCKRHLGAAALRLVRSQPHRPDDHRLKRVGQRPGHTYTLTAQPDGTTDIDYVVVRARQEPQGTLPRPRARVRRQRRLQNALDQTVPAIEARNNGAQAVGGHADVLAPRATPGPARIRSSAARSQAPGWNESPAWQTPCEDATPRCAG